MSGGLRTGFPRCVGLGEHFDAELGGGGFADAVACRHRDLAGKLAPADGGVVSEIAARSGGAWWPLLSIAPHHVPSGDPYLVSPTNHSDMPDAKPSTLATTTASMATPMEGLFVIKKTMPSSSAM